MDKKWFDNMESKIPHGKVRSRFAPSPTGFMHIGNLRTALYAYLIAKKAGGTFILRIEDTDTARFVEGATEVVLDTLKRLGLTYDEGPDNGGPVAPYTQSERKELYRPYAELLCEKGAAYYCFCEAEELDKDTDSKTYELRIDPCRELPYDTAKLRVDKGDSFVVRMLAPRDGETVVNDMVFGEMITPNKVIEDMILLKRDGLPTYNFANVVDDHLMGITHVLRGSEYISSAPKYNILYNAFEWKIPEYVTVSPIMRDAQNKFSKRHGDPTYDDLLVQGYLPEAILNYVALLGWSPGGEREIFSLNEMTELFDVKGISKAPAIFDIDKLNHFNGEYIRALPPEKFAEIALPYIKEAVKTESLCADSIASILQARCVKLTDIPPMIDFFDKLPDYDIELYTNKKAKTNEQVSLDMLTSAYDALETLSDWTVETIGDSLTALSEKMEIKKATVMSPIRVAVSGKTITPGGAVEICFILGRTETLRRIKFGIDKLSSER